MYAELFVRRKASTNHHHTTLADPPLSFDTPDWKHSASLLLLVRLRDTCTPGDDSQHIEIRQHAGASTTTSPSAAAYAWRRWWYAQSLPYMATVSTNHLQALLRLHHLLPEDYHPDPTTRKSREEYVLSEKTKTTTSKHYVNVS